MLQLVICYIVKWEISIGANADNTKTKRQKQIVFVVERWMQCLLLWLKPQSAREISCHPAFMGNCRLLVTHASFIYLVDKFFFLLLV